MTRRLDYSKWDHIEVSIVFVLNGFRYLLNFHLGCALLYKLVIHASILQYLVTKLNFYDANLWVTPYPRRQALEPCYKAI